MGFADAKPDRFTKYTHHVDRLMLVLAFVFLVVWSTRIIFREDLPQSVLTTLLTIQFWIWLAFVTDLVIRTVLSEKSWKFLWTHPLDVVAVLLPAARPLKILTVFTQGTMLASSTGRVKTMQAVVLSTALLLWIGAVWVLSAERGAPGASIETFGDALWWAIVTVTTVGFGDFTPVTTTGRMVASGMMLLGIALIGVVTASVAAWFVSLTSTQDEASDDVRDTRDDAMAQRVVDLEAKIDRLLAIHDSNAEREQRKPGR
ncbi:potassium channel family protein [Demequina aurantiaca]|uniref:potassium channel family protein n=1 Tax=Demequina aurantiaca TaxID=676200 RepID=UPI003D34EF55